MAPPRAMNTSQAQVIDPILSTQARGYRNAEFIGARILPYADIPNRSMKVIRFGKDSFRRYMDTRRAPGGERKRITFGYASDPVSLKQESLEAVVPDEIRGDAAGVPGIDLATVSINGVQDIIGLGREVEIAGLVRDPANYDAANKVALAGTDVFSDPASDPKAVIKEGREAVRRKIGRYPNKLAIGPDVFNALDEHPKIVEKFKYTSSDSITPEMLAKYFNLKEVIVGEAVALAETAADTDLADDVWGNDALLFFQQPGNSFLIPSFGYTYRLRGYPSVGKPYREENRSSWIYQVTEEDRPQLTGMDAGYLIQNAA